MDNFCTRPIICSVCLTLFNMHGISEYFALFLGGTFSILLVKLTWLSFAVLSSIFQSFQLLTNRPLAFGTLVRSSWPLQILSFIWDPGHFLVVLLCLFLGLIFSRLALNSRLRIWLNFQCNVSSVEFVLDWFSCSECNKMKHRWFESMKKLPIVFS